MSGGWTFSSDLSADDLANVQGLIAANGLAQTAGSTGETADADAAFARMVAANPGARVIDGPSDAAASPDIDAEIARVTAANPNATIIRGPAASRGTAAALLPWRVKDSFQPVLTAV